MQRRSNLLLILVIAMAFAFFSLGDKTVGQWSGSRLGNLDATNSPHWWKKDGILPPPQPWNFGPVKFCQSQAKAEACVALPHLKWVALGLNSRLHRALLDNIAELHSFSCVGSCSRESSTLPWECRPGPNEWPPNQQNQTHVGRASTAGDLVVKFRPDTFQQHLNWCTTVAQTLRRHAA